MSRRYVPVGIGFAVLLVGCTDSQPKPSEPTQPHLARSHQPAAVARLQYGGVERMFSEVAESVPGFAGFYYDKTGNLIIRLTHMPAEREVIAEVRRVLHAAQRRVDRATVQPAQFSFVELAGWRDLLRPRLPGGVYSIDLDEVHNLISVGVADEAVVQRIQVLADRLGLPEAALRSYVAPPPQLRQSLTSTVRPIRGGVEHTWTNGTACTVGINGEWAYSSDYVGFMTASHCSQTYAYLDNQTTYYYQPGTQSSSYRVGYEFSDPEFWGGSPCPAGAVCRWSDVLFVRYMPGTNPSGYNTIAKPTGSPAYGGRGSTAIGGTFTIPQDYHAVVGDELHKVGRTSGWTYGYMTGSCVDKWSGTYETVTGSNLPLWILCNSITDIWSEGGDSGSPVFLWYDKSTDMVYFAGILWGGPANNFHETWFSPYSSIREELVNYNFYF